MHKLVDKICVLQTCRFPIKRFSDDGREERLDNPHRLLQGVVSQLKQGLLLAELRRYPSKLMKNLIQQVTYSDKHMIGLLTQIVPILTRFPTIL